MSAGNDAKDYQPVDVAALRARYAPATCGSEASLLRCLDEITRLRAEVAAAMEHPSARWVLREDFEAAERERDIHANGEIVLNEKLHEAERERDEARKRLTEEGRNVLRAKLNFAERARDEALHRVDAVIDGVARVLDDAGIGRAPGGDLLDRMRLLTRERDEARRLIAQSWAALTETAPESYPSGDALLLECRKADDARDEARAACAAMWRALECRCGPEYLTRGRHAAQCLCHEITDAGRGWISPEVAEQMAAALRDAAVVARDFHEGGEDRLSAIVARGRIAEALAAYEKARGR